MTCFVRSWTSFPTASGPDSTVLTRGRCPCHRCLHSIRQLMKKTNNNNHNIDWVHSPPPCPVLHPPPPTTVASQSAREPSFNQHYTGSHVQVSVSVVPRVNVAYASGFVIICGVKKREGSEVTPNICNYLEVYVWK